MTYDPNIRWYMDWDGDGLFANALSDVTQYVEEYNVRWGSSADQPTTLRRERESDQVVSSAGIIASSATGQLVLLNRDNIFDPFNPSGTLSPDVLERPVSARVVHDGKRTWQGRAIPVPDQTVREITYYRWELEGSQAEQMRNNYRIVQTPQTFGEIAIEGVRMRVDSPLPAGIIAWNGRLLEFITEIAKLVGGFAIEDGLGNIVIQPMANIASTGILLSLENKPDDNAYVGPIASFVANRAVFQSQRWQPEVTIDEAGSSTPVVRQMGTRTVQMVDGTTRVVRFDVTDLVRVDSWEESIGEGAVVGGEPDDLFLTQQTGVSGAFLDVYTVSEITGIVNVTYRAEVSLLHLANERQLDITGSQSSYGTRDIRLQPWLASTLEGAEQWTAQWVKNLSEPLTYIRVTYPEIQDTEGLFTTLLSTQPGTAVDVILPNRYGEEFAQNMWVLANYIQGGYNQAPTRTIFGVAINDVTPDLIEGLRATTLGPRVIEVTVNNLMEAGETLYVDVSEVT